MYCIKCGVKLADTESCCPLCGTEVFHPEIIRQEAPPIYPSHAYPAQQVSSKAALIVWTTVILVALVTSLLCDLQLNRQIIWSGFVVGGLMVGYVMFVLPYWFRRPNPVVFVPCSFAAVGLYLLYINLATGGQWFLSFAFPVTGYVAAVVTAVVVLLKYLRRGLLYIFGGAFLAMGVFMPLMEFLLCITFESVRFIGWSLYPLIALVLLGAMLIFLAIHRPSRETMERKFFL